MDELSKLEDMTDELGKLNEMKGELDEKEFGT